MPAHMHLGVFMSLGPDPNKYIIKLLKIFGGIRLKEYQDLIGKIAIAIAIVVFGLIVAGALTAGFSNMHSAIVNMGDSIRDGLIKVANQ